MENLNPQQRAAVDSKAALKVLICGPGSGKSRCVIEAVKAVPEGSRVALMTFTQAGSHVFRQRLPETIKLAHCGTLHSYCFKLIQNVGDRLGYIPGKVGILPDKERIPRLLACRDKLGAKSVSEKALLAHQTGSNRIDKAIELIWKEYGFLLKRNNLVDYDGILRDALELIQMPDVRAWARLDYLFVDEYQDSAQIDQAIYDAIPATNKMMVGDPDQSIFGFRGAFPLGMVTLASGLAEVHKLELNYRSGRSICFTANALIAHNKERVAKTIVPTMAIPSQVEVAGYEDAGQELAALGACISNNTLATKQSIAVLYRMNHDVKVCRDYLRSMGIPIQEPKFEQRPPDWERAMLLIGLLVSPENAVLAERYLLLDNPPNTVRQWQLQDAVKMRPLAERIALGWVSGPPGAMSYGDIAGRNNYQLLAKNGVSEGTIRAIEARAELLAPDANLSDLLHDLHSNEDTKASDDAFGVYVGTIHSAKGREWDVVFLPAFEQGILPSTQALKSLGGPGLTGDEKVDFQAQENLRVATTAIEEDRRLAFVAVTRARHSLFISWSKTRQLKWGGIQDRTKSRFIAEMGLA